MSKMGDYVIWLEERGYTEWDEDLDGYVFVDGVDTSKTMKEYLDDKKKKIKKEEDNEISNLG